METQSCSFSYKIVEKFGKPGIYLFTTRINKLLDIYVSWHPETRGKGYQCLLSYLEQQWFLYVLPFRLVGWKSVTIYSDKANAMIPAVATNHQPGPAVFWLSLRNLTLPHKTFKYHRLCKTKQNKKNQLIAVRVIILQKTIWTLQT